MKQKRTHRLISLNKFFSVCLAVLFIGFFTAQISHAYMSPGKPSGFVNDFAGVISSGAKSDLENKLTQFKKDTGYEISVVTVKSLEGDTIENYGNSLFREWGIGDKERNNGVLMILAIEDRALRIEVGYGVEGTLTDLSTKNIQDSLMLPELKVQNYDKAISGGVGAIMEAIKGDATYATQAPPGGKNYPSFGTIVFLIFFFFQIIIGILAPTKSWWLGGVIGVLVGVVVAVVVSSLILGAILVPVFLGLGLALDYAVSKAYQVRGKSRRDFWTGGGFGGFGGGLGGGGFGGFGGGSSGGGGSSSRW